MRRSRSILSVLVAIVLLHPLSAQDDPVDAFVRAQMVGQNVPGLSLVVVRDGAIVKAAGYGVADRAQNTPATPDTVYKIGSVSKQFLAAAVMLLVQEQRLRLEAPITRYLDNAPAAWDAITIRHLLTHTSGLIREAPGFDPFRIQPDADVIRTAYPRALLFPPGAKWAYSNLGYFAIAEIISRVAGQPWQEFLAARIFTPLGMTATRVTTSEPVANRATGYTDNATLTAAAEWPAVRPSGAWLSTVRDLAKWEAALLGDRLLNPATRGEMWTRVTLSDGSTEGYGFGWHLGAIRGRRTIYHGGGIPGFNAFYQRFADERLAVIVLMNTDDADEQTIALGVASRYLPEPAAR